MINPLASPFPPTELTVVGEHKANPELLLLLGADGRYYAYSLEDETTAPVEPDDTTWAIEPSAPQDFFE
jgi:hypothetical protein